MRRHLALALAIPLTLVLAGCVNSPEDLEAASADDTLVVPTATTTTPFSFDGSFGPMVWACPVVTCEGIEPSSQRWTELDIDGNLTALTLTMTWDPTPNMETLRLGISWGENGEDYESVQGPSPLVLELTGLDINGDDEPYLWTWTGDSLPVSLVYTSTPTEFHIEGEIVTTPEASA